MINNIHDSIVLTLIICNIPAILTSRGWVHGCLLRWQDNEFMNTLLFERSMLWVACANFIFIHKVILWIINLCNVFATYMSVDDLEVYTCNETYNNLWVYNTTRKSINWQLYTLLDNPLRFFFCLLHVIDNVIFLVYHPHLQHLQYLFTW